MKKRTITVALLMALSACEAPTYAGKAVLSQKEMLRITAHYPDLKTKEEPDLMKKASEKIEQISKDFSAIKIKGEDNERNLEACKKDLEETKKLANEAVKSHGAHDEDMKALKNKCDAMEKSMNELDLRSTKGKNENFGLVDYKTFSKIHKEKMADFEKCKSDGSRVSISLKAHEFFGMRKAAGNMTETGNYLQDFVIAPDRLPGYFAPPLRPIHIREFINSAPTESNMINYNTETAYTDGSGSTAQGAAAAQSDFTLTANQSVLQKINTYYTLAKEMLADTPVTENYIRTRGVARLLMFEDTALLTGNGTPPNQYGLQPVASAYTLVPIPGATSTSINYYDVLHQAVTQAKVAYYTPNIILIHPNDYNTLALSRDTYGRYQFPQMVTGQPGQFYINGALVVPNTAVTQGYFYVGDFELGATLFHRDEIEITFSNQHVDNFIKGYITVMIEERLIMAIYRPTAFIYGNFATAVQSGS